MTPPATVPEPAAHARPERWRRWSIIGLGLVALLTYVGLTAFHLRQAHDREVEFARRSQENLAKVLERHALTAVEKIDTVLVASRLLLERAGPGAGAADINAALGKHLALIPESQSLRVADAEGRFIYDASGVLASARILDRPYFHRNRDDPGGGLVISEPLFARITKNWVITLSRRLTGPDGHFAGLVQAAVRADHFQSFYAALNLGHAQSVALLDAQARLVARYPEAPGQLGKVAASAPLRQAIAAGLGETVYSTHSGVDGVHRLYAMHRVGSHPLYVVVGRATDDYLASWRGQVLAGVVSSLVLAIVLTGWAVVWLRTYDQAHRLARGMTVAYETTVRRTRALLDSLPDPAWLADRDDRMIAVNEAYAQACGRPPAEIIGRTLPEIWPDPAARTLMHQHAEALSSQGPCRREATQEIAGGALRCFEYISTPVQDEAGQLIGVAGVARDITRIREDERRIRHLAEHDMLTDLPNRVYLNERLARTLAEAVGEQAGVALLFIDLDHFKNVNDTLGHEIGDQLLLQVARRLREHLDPSDTLSRQGGDEFTILLQHSSRLPQVAEIAQRVIDAVAEPFRVDSHELRVTASVGISTYPQDGTDIGTLLRNADTAMYQAKAAGGNTYRFFTPEMNARVSERVSLENSLRRALQAGEFQLHYQPQVDAGTGALVGLEALIRWHHPEQGAIPPGRFIPVAEESNLISAIGDWVLREACRQLRAWLDRGWAPVTVAVNLSANQFRQPDLAHRIMATLEESGLEPRWLELEITESVFIRDTARIVEVLAELRGLGVKLSVDDFGTGYSSLGYLKRLPFDTIKIDQSFIRDLPGDEDDVAITRAIIGIAESLQKGLIAEGVETGAQRDFLLRHGCRRMQGYHFSRPVPAAEVEVYLREGGAARWAPDAAGG